MAEDRRMVRTRAALRSALAQLLATRNYDSITVSQIIETANIGRSTFYAHCASKDDLLRLGLRTLHDEISAAAEMRQPSPAVIFRFSLPLLLHVREHSHIARRLNGRGLSIFLEEMDRIVARLVAAQTHLIAPGDEVTVQLIKGAFISCMAWWLQQGAAQPPEMLDQRFQRMARCALLGGADKSSG